MKCFDKGGGGEEAPQWYLRAKANKVKEGVRSEERRVGKECSS